MKAFILAAGNGTRLHPLTARIPKCLVPIRGVPLLKIWLDVCERYGINNVTINSHAHCPSVREYLESCRTPVKVRLFEEPTLLGSAGTLRSNANWIGQESDFFVFYGDVLTTLDIGQMLCFHRSKGMPVTIALHAVENPSECGIATLDADGIVQDFVEKPAQPSSNMGFCGVMIASPTVLSEIPPGTADIGHHLLPQLLGRMSGYLTHEYLTDIGTMAAYERAQQTWPGLDGCDARGELLPCALKRAPEQGGLER
jgi:mannose-1-phosphate guanylyltransferase